MLRFFYFTFSFILLCIIKLSSVDVTVVIYTKYITEEQVYDILDNVKLIHNDRVIVVNDGKLNLVNIHHYHKWFYNLQVDQLKLYTPYVFVVRGTFKTNDSNLFSVCKDVLMHNNAITHVHPGKHDSDSLQLETVDRIAIEYYIEKIHDLHESCVFTHASSMGKRFDNIVAFIVPPIVTT